MGYQALSLKYRPAKLDEVIGQEHIVESLKEAIISKRIHHAYLFSGPRGVGKTSMARILAKSLNCLEYNEPTLNPCNKCVSCKEISESRSLDVIEIDGASNRGIDEIRTLRENVKLYPAYSRYKIYIIDEVHQITSDAFNALLKTLEEPPPHVKFIFATTHPQKVLPTILSRCQKFQFGLLPVDKIVKKLKFILEKEKVNIEEELLYSIAYSSGGSIRDAESLLDQFIPIILSGQSVKDIFPFLGIIDETSLNLFMEKIINKDLTGCIDFIARISEEGKDIGVFTKNLIEHFRILLLIKVSPKSINLISEISPATKEFLSKIAEKTTPQDILKIIDYLIESQSTAKKISSLRIPLELAVIKYAFGYTQGVSNNSNREVSESIRDKNPIGTGNSVVVKQDPKVNGNEVVTDRLDDLGHSINEILKTKIVQEDDNSDDTYGDGNKDDNSASLDLDSFILQWNSIIHDIERKKVVVASYLKEGEVLGLENNILILGFHKKYSLHREILEKVSNKKYVENKLKEHTGIPLKVRYVSIDNKESVEKKAPHLVKDEHSQEDTQMINKLMDTFDGQLCSEDE